MGRPWPLILYVSRSKAATPASTTGLLGVWNSPDTFAGAEEELGKFERLVISHLAGLVIDLIDAGRALRRGHRGNLGGQRGIKVRVHVGSLCAPGDGRIIRLKAKGVFFSQGNSADSVFYLQKGRAKVTVVSEAGMVYAIGPACGCKVRWLSHLSRMEAFAS